MTHYDVYAYIEDGRYDMYRGVDVDKTFRDAVRPMLEYMPNVDDLRPLIIIERYIN